MSIRFTIIAASLFVFLFSNQEILAQQKAPLNDSAIAELANDIDEPVVFVLNMEPDAPAEAIVISAESEATPRMILPRVETRIIASNSDQPFMHLRMLSEEAVLDHKEK